MPTPDQVPGTGNAGPVAPASATPPAGSVTPQSVTPSNPPVDADAIKKAREEAEQLRRDVNNLKSMSQRREAELKADAERIQREAQAEIERQTMAQMDDDEREKYQSAIAQRRVQELQEELNDVRAKQQVQENLNASMNWFLDQGVPISALDRSSPEALVQSGYAYFANRIKELESKPAAPATPPAAPPPQAPPKAPQVDTNTGAPATPQSYADAWDALIEKFGSRERVYKLVELRQLPKSIIPLMPEAQ